MLSDQESIQVAQLMPLSVRREVGDMNHKILAAVQPPEIHYFGQNFGKISAG